MNENWFKKTVSLYLVEFALKQAYQTTRNHRLKSLYKLAITQVNQLDKNRLQDLNLV